MSRAGEFAGFLCVAALVHVGLWAGVSRTGSTSAGSGGEASLSLVAASGDLTEMVATWTRPVDVVQAISPMTSAHEMSQGEVAMPNRPETAKPDRVAPEIAMPNVPQSLPQVDTKSVRPEVMKAAPKTSPRPKDRSQKPAALPKEKAAPKPEPKAPAEPSQSSGAIAQTAKGSRSGQNAGDTTDQRSANLSKAARQSLLAEWGASIRNRVERRKRYPSGTNASGTTVLRISVHRDGHLVAVSVVKSSGTRVLDQAAVNAVQRARFRAAPPAIEGSTFQFNLPLAFARN